MIWSEKAKEAVAQAICDCYEDNHWPDWMPEAQAALAAVAESDEWKAKDQEIAEQCRIIGASGSRELKLLGEIERLKRQVSVLRELAIAMKNTQYHARVNETLAAADKIGEE